MDPVDPERDLLLKHPWTCLVAGATSSGKSTIVARLINSLPSIMTPDLPKPIRVIWCMGSYASPAISDSKQISLKVIVGPPPEEPDCDVLIIDDQMSDMVDSKKLSDLFSKHSHHKRISIFFIVQNVFAQGRYMRNITLNAHYLILTKSRRDLTQVKKMGQQLFGRSDYFFSAYKKAVLDRPYGYLLVDLSPSTDEKFRLRTDILPDEYPVTVFYPEP
jgi:hypothetical protein